MDDNCPLTILEAVSCGLPVVCFSNTGMTELISLLKLSELNDKPRILDNLSTPNDYEVWDFHLCVIITCKFIGVVISFLYFVPETIPIKVRF